MEYQEITKIKIQCLELAVNSVRENNARYMLSTPVAPDMYANDVITTAELYFNWITQ